MWVYEPMYTCSVARGKLQVCVYLLQGPKLSFDHGGLLKIMIWLEINS